MSRAEPACRCTDCAAVWHSDLLVDGLRLIGTCPRCGTGTLAFRDAPSAASEIGTDAAAALAPHRVLGVPRR